MKEYSSCKVRNLFLPLFPQFSKKNISKAENNSLKDANC